MAAECITARIIAIKSHTNWLMSIAARECNLSESNFGVHHSMHTELHMFMAVSITRKVT